MAMRDYTGHPTGMDRMGMDPSGPMSLSPESSPPTPRGPHLGQQQQWYYHNGMMQPRMPPMAPMPPSYAMQDSAMGGWPAPVEVGGKRLRGSTAADGAGKERTARSGHNNRDDDVRQGLECPPDPLEVMSRLPHFFSPYLSLGERLSLGLCNKRLLYALDRSVSSLTLGLAPPPSSSGNSVATADSTRSPSPVPPSGLCMRFPRLTSLTLHELAGSPGALLAVLQLLGNHGWPSLKTLRLHRLRLDRGVVGELCRVMAQGCLRHLKALDLSDCTGLDADCLTCLAEVLARGGVCPQLTSLNLRGAAPAPPPQHLPPHEASALRVALDYLGVAFQSRYAPPHKPLLRLHLSHCGAALLTRLCPKATPLSLKTLDLSYACLSWDDVLTLGETLMDRRAPALEILRVSGAAQWNASASNGMSGRESGHTLTSALAVGALPRLRILELEGVGLSGRAMDSLVAAITHQNLADASELYLNRAALCGQQLDRLLSAMLGARQHSRLSPLPYGSSLRVLSLSRNRQLGTHGGVALGRALGARLFPSLALLDLHDCNIGDAGAAELAQALGMGGAPCGLSLQKVVLSSCLIREAGAAAWGNLVLGTPGACPSLEVLSLSLNLMGPQGIAHLARGLGAGEAGGCRRLRTLELNFTDMGEGGARALTAALSKADVAPLLDRLEVLQWSSSVQRAGQRTMADLRAAAKGRRGSNSEGWPVYVVG